MCINLRTGITHKPGTLNAEPPSRYKQFVGGINTLFLLKSLKSGRTTCFNVDLGLAITTGENAHSC